MLAPASHRCGMSRTISLFVTLRILDIELGHTLRLETASLSMAADGPYRDCFESLLISSDGYENNLVSPRGNFFTVLGFYACRHQAKLTAEQNRLYLLIVVMSPPSGPHEMHRRDSVRCQPLKPLISLQDLDVSSHQMNASLKSRTAASSNDIARFITVVSILLACNGK